MRRHDHLPAAQALALLRIALGAVLILSGVGKFTVHRVGGVVPVPAVSAAFQQELPARLQSWASQRPSGAMGAIARDLLIPRGRLVAGVIAWVQLGSGLALVLGLFTTVAAAGAIMVAGALALSAAARSGADARAYALMGLMAVALILGRAGLVWGLDGWRSERRRHREI